MRCWEPVDAPLSKEAVDSSLEHLRPWLPWAHELPMPLEETVELLRRFRGDFDLGQNFIYGIFSRDESEVLGGTGLHTRRGEGVFEIGYWIRAGRAGEGLTTEATAALTRVAFEVCEVERVEIRADPENGPSLAIPRKLGFVEEGTLRGTFHASGKPLRADAVVLALLREELEGTPSAGARLEAFDAVGNRVLG